MDLDSLISVRNRYAVARSRDDLERLQLESERLIRDTDTYIAVRAAASHSYYAYLLGSSAKDANVTLDIVSPRIRSGTSEHDLRCSLVLYTARHRLARNGGLSGIREIHSAATSVCEQLSQLAPKAEEVSEWIWEAAHYFRYRGNWRKALDFYTRPTPADWHPVGATYQQIVLSHYLISLACDWYEWFALYPIVPLTSEQRDGCSAVLKALHVDPAGLGDYPMFRGHHAKHRALCLALLGENVGAASSLQVAKRLFDRLGERKGQILCREFRALIDLRRGRIAEATTTIQGLQEQAVLYYPRLSRVCTFHLGCLAILEERIDEGVTVLRSLSLL